MSTFARVTFSVRRPTPDNHWEYERISPGSPYGSGFIPMNFPPAVGDLIILQDEHRDIEGGPVFQVVARQWATSNYGSPSWPYTFPEPKEGPLLDIVVEPADEGSFRNEKPEDELL
jgi:hypothetical protein